jgi:peroxiredoxin
MPFALKRFCGDNDIDNVLTLSDARTKQFAQEN